VRHLILIITSLLVTLSANVRADDDFELYTTEVCNSGSLPVDVAVAYWEYNGFVSGHYWRVDYWYEVAAGKCERVFYHNYLPNDLETDKFPLHIAFAFTDATGVWGAAPVRSWKGPEAQRSNLRLCVQRNSFKYRFEQADPASLCEGPDGNRSYFSIPAAIDFEPLHGNQIDRGTNYYHERTFTIALGPADRATPLGQQAAPAKSGGTADQFHRLLQSISDPRIIDAKGVDASGHAVVSPGYRLLDVCVKPAVITLESLADLGSPRAQEIVRGISKFMHQESRDPGRLVMSIVERQGLKFYEVQGDSCAPADEKFLMQVQLD
jgi:hypothetical protein